MSIIRQHRARSHRSFSTQRNATDDGLDRAGEAATPPETTSSHTTFGRGIGRVFGGGGFVSVLFLLSTLLSYFALRTPGGVSLERYADLLLVAGLVLLVARGFMLAWELGTFPVTAP